MANEENLRPGEYKLTLEEQKKGGRASAAARKRKKELRECLEILLEKEYEAADGTVVTGADRISARLFRNALEGDNKAFEIIRDTTGQKPVERVETVEISEETYRRVEEALKD